MSNRVSKRTFDEVASNYIEETKSISIDKSLKNVTILENKSIFQDLCTDIILEIFQYFRPIDLLYSFTGLYLHLDVLLEPYTHTIDFRCINKSYFQSLTQSLFPCFTNNLRVLRLSNAYTFGQISETLNRLDWSKINQLESLTFDLIDFDELSKYFLVIHPLLKHLWRLSLTFNQNCKFVEKLLIDQILLPTSQSQSLKNCFIVGIIFNLNKLSGHKLNENLRELTLTLATIDDLIILFRSLPHLEILTCTVFDSTYNENLDKIQSLDFLTVLTLNIKKSILFKTLQKILIPHIKLKQLSLQAILHDQNVSTNSNQEIGGLALEKLFRTFPQLKKLQFYIRHLHSTDDAVKNHAPDHLYLFSFTSHFWLDRSIEVFTHFVEKSKQRCTYTLPFAFDTFDIDDVIPTFFFRNYPYYYANVHHLSLSSTSILDEFIYSSMILKFFPNIRTITFFKQPLNSTINILIRHQWVLQKSSSDDCSAMVFPCVYTHNHRKATHLYFRTLNITNKDQILYANDSRRIRQITIYEMTQEQSIDLKNSFPQIQILTLYVNRLEWFFSSNDWFYHLLTDMRSLFSLTVYYPKNLNNQNLRDLLAITLLNVKKHFYIKCNDGILNIWF
ncbi:unnamed protein product [Rotaria sp. Silwood1]|nr:unnamed protein product [Rotaria sp. Silwood1]CAF1156981.1 unnamed protein product [Rotaria sp. Silwood1]CAF3426028.1 unnamed protein product [Rotaria sp. Silwood1]CAF3430394.1 unnamed protein product [Rotaria sp. Silwood1]CAF4686982.1 unnamed protein product [Rotaria sp. Silwood1]